MADHGAEVSPLGDVGLGWIGKSGRWVQCRKR